MVIDPYVIPLLRILLSFKDETYGNTSYGLNLCLFIFSSHALMINGVVLKINTQQVLVSTVCGGDC